MPMMTSQTLKYKHSPKIKIPKCLEKKTFFLQIEKSHDDPLQATICLKIVVKQGNL